jgi:hypothetical protein
MYLLILSTAQRVRSYVRSVFFFEISEPPIQKYDVSIEPASPIWVKAAI